MTIQEFNTEFDILYNSISTATNPGIDIYEKSVYLTKAQLEIIKNYYNPLGNKYQKGFENSEKRRVDLEQLVVNFNSTNKILSNNGISSNSQFFQIPNNVFLIVYEKAKITSTNPCLNNKDLKVIPKTHDEYNYQIDNPFKKPNTEEVWRLNISKQNNNKVSELISPFNISNYNIRYIKYPNPIILADLTTTFPSEGLSIDGQTNAQTCELDQSIHREILDRAVELAMADYYKSNLDTKIQLDTRNE